MVVYNQIESYMTSQFFFTIYCQAFAVLIQPISVLHIKRTISAFQMDKGFYNSMVMIDSQKAFDTVDHDILLHKLKTLGFHDLSVLWLESYLTNRNLKTEINGTFSDPGVVPCGVSCQLILYADDSALLVSGRDVGLIEERLGNEVSSLNGWLVDNRLSIHLGKT